MDSTAASTVDEEVNALIAAGRHGEAEAILVKELAARPNNAAALDALGVCLYFQDRLEESTAACRRATFLDSKRAGTWFNLGTALSDDGHPDEAVDAYRRCLALDPSNESAKYNLSRSLLLLGQWTEGWQLYEARGRKKNPLYRAPDFERWTGEPPGRYVLVLTTEQGIGDAIQFSRFAGELKRQGYEVLLWTPPLLAPLFKGAAGLGHVFVGNGLKVDGAPVKWLPLMSIPAAIGLEPSTVPATPYLRAEPERVAQWAKTIGKGGYKIGIVWQGNSTHANDTHRSMRLADLKPLAEISGLRLISLQKQPDPVEISEAGLGDRLEILTDAKDVSAEALLDTAAIMANLNMVISVDTMTAHLAGALGRPVWLALDDRPDWRWLLDRTDTPWYPTMRLFRQRRRGDWSTIVATMASALRSSRLM
jgi:hypothetical protein